MNPRSAGTTIIGDKTTHRGMCCLRSEDKEAPWFRTMPVETILDEFGIRHLGVVDAVYPYRFERKSLPAPVMLACVSGTGRVCTDSEWIDLGAGRATVLRGGEGCCYHAIEGVPWKMVWICFGRDALAPAAAVAASKEFAVLPLLHAVECLMAEWHGAADPVNLRQILGLIERMVNRYTSPTPELSGFYSAWSEAGRNPGLDWTLESLARLATCSAEQFRRVCQREFGTSPMRYLTNLRLRIARQRLLAGNDTVETIAREIGYYDAYAFSRAFRKHSGLLPTELRKEAAAKSSP